MPISKNERKRRERISATLKRYLATPEGKKQRIKSSTGRKHSQETKQKISILRSGKGNGMFKKTHTTTAKEKISIANKGKIIPEETRRKIGESNRGKTRSQKIRKQISKSLKEYYKNKPGTFTGRKHSKKSKQKMKEANLEKYDGPNHPQWQGGIVVEPYCDVWLDKNFKESIKERDGYECQNPDCWGKCNHLPLHVHHINYDKKNCHPWNLITLCCSCNCRANFDRKYWEFFYQNIIKNTTETSVNQFYQN